MKIEDIIKIIQPNPSEEHIKEGIFHYNNNHYENAIYHYTKAIEYNNKLAVAHNNRGVSYFKLQKYNLAMDDFNSAVSLDASFSDAYLHMGLVFLNTKEINNAINMLRNNNVYIRIINNNIRFKRK